MQYAWLRVIASPVRAGIGGGAAHATGGEQTPRMKEPERVSHQVPGLRDKRPRHALAFTDAVRADRERARLRLIPLMAS